VAVGDVGRRELLEEAGDVELRSVELAGVEVSAPYVASSSFPRSSQGGEPASKTRNSMGQGSPAWAVAAGLARMKNVRMCRLSQEAPTDETGETSHRPLARFRPTVRSFLGRGGFVERRRFEVSEPERLDEFGCPEWVGPLPSSDELTHSDGEPLETDRHVEAMHLLIRSLKTHWADRDDFFVGGDMFFYYSAMQSKRIEFRGPDVFVVLDVDRHTGRKSWVLWEEDGKVPAVIIELMSKTTEHVDRGRKKDVYSIVGVPTYVLYDPYSADLEVSYLDDETGRYRAAEQKGSGRYEVPGLGLELGVWEGKIHGTEAPWLRWFEPDGGVVMTGDERAREARTQAAEAEALLAKYRERFGEL